MHEESQLSPVSSATRGALGLAAGSVVLLLVAFAVFNPEPLADESGHHVSAIRQFAGGDWSWPQDLVMWPTYHVVASLPARLFGADVFVLRAFSALMTVGAVWLLFSPTRHEETPSRN